MTEPPVRWRQYQQFRADLIEETKRSSLTPAAIADVLEIATEFREAGYVLDYEIRAYRRSPDEWRGVKMFK